MLSTPALRIGLYGNGRAATEVLKALPAEFTLTKSVVFFDEQNGQDIGTLTGGTPVGVTATTDLEGVVRSGDVDVLVYTGLSGDTLIRAMQLCAEAGIDLVHACFVHPRVKLEPEVYSALQAAACESGSRIVGTGILPGFWLDVLPALLVSALPAPISIRGRSVADISLWGRGVLEREIGVGSPAQDGEPGPVGGVLHESAQMLAEFLGVSGKCDIRGGFVVADTTTTTLGIDVAAGDRLGFDQAAVFIDSDGSERIDLSWCGLPADAVDGFTRSLVLTLIGGDGSQITLDISTPPDPYPGTAARLVHAVRGLQSLPGGFHTPVELAI